MPVHRHTPTTLQRNLLSTLPTDTETVPHPATILLTKVPTLSNSSNITKLLDRVMEAQVMAKDIQLFRISTVANPFQVAVMDDHRLLKAWLVK
jgi:hypothetical protein